MAERVAASLKELSEALTAASGYVSGIERLVAAEGGGEERLPQAVAHATEQLRRSRAAFERLREELQGQPPMGTEPK